MSLTPVFYLVAVWCSSGQVIFFYLCTGVPAASVLLKPLQQWSSSNLFYFSCSWGDTLSAFWTGPEKFSYPLTQFHQLFKDKYIWRVRPFTSDFVFNFMQNSDFTLGYLVVIGTFVYLAVLTLLAPSAQARAIKKSWFPSRQEHVDYG